MLAKYVHKESGGRSSRQGSSNTRECQVGEKDEVVPTVNQKRLQELWKPETVIRFKQDHFLSIVYTWLFKSSKITKFFSRAQKSE